MKSMIHLQPVANCVDCQQEDHVGVGVLIRPRLSSWNGGEVEVEPHGQEHQEGQLSENLIFLKESYFNLFNTKWIGTQYIT